jgi:hypothetical protein
MNQRLTVPLGPLVALAELEVRLGPGTPEGERVCRSRRRCRMSEERHPSHPAILEVQPVTPTARELSAESARAQARQTAAAPDHPQR